MAVRGARRHWVAIGVPTILIAITSSLYFLSESAFSSSAVAKKRTRALESSSELVVVAAADDLLPFETTNANQIWRPEFDRTFHGAAARVIRHGDDLSWPVDWTPLQRLSIPAGAQLLFVGAGDIADIFTSLCHTSNQAAARAGGGGGATPRWCPDFDDHIHNEFLLLEPKKKKSNNKPAMARFLYWDGSTAFSTAVSEVLCGGGGAGGEVETEAEGEAPRPSVMKGWVWPTHVVFGRGMVDLYHLNPELEEIASNTSYALHRLSSVLEGRSAFCTTSNDNDEDVTAKAPRKDDGEDSGQEEGRTRGRRSPTKKGKKETENGGAQEEDGGKHRGGVWWVLPRFVPERPLHVGCTTEARQVELLSRFVKVAETMKAPVRLIDAWNPTRAWPHDVFDWRGLALRNISDVVKYAQLVLHQAFPDSSMSSSSSRSVTTALPAAAERLNRLLEDITPSKAFTVPWGPTLGRRHCNSQRSFHRWFHNDTVARLNFTLFWTVHRQTTYRIPKHDFGPPTRWDGRDKDLAKAIWERNPPPPTGPVDIHWKDSPCGDIPTPYDEGWEFTMRTLGTRWPTKPMFVEAPCAPALTENPAWSSLNETTARPDPSAGLEPFPEPLGPRRCVFFWAPPEPVDNNWPDVDFEGCLAHGQVRALYVGSSHQDMLRDVKLSWWTRDIRDSDLVSGVTFGQTKVMKTLHIDGQLVLGISFNPRASDQALRDASSTWTHVLFGTTTFGNIFDDWTGAEAAYRVKRWMEAAVSPRGGAHPSLLQLVMYIEHHFRGRPSRREISDQCSHEFRIEMYREAQVCAAAHVLRDWQEAKSTSRRGFRVFNSKPMTKHPIAELLAPVWDGHHYYGAPIGYSITYHEVRMMCNEWIAVNTSAKPLRIDGKDSFGFTGTEEQPLRNITEGWQRAIPSEHGGFPRLTVRRLPPVEVPPVRKSLRTTHRSTAAATTTTTTATATTAATTTTSTSINPSSGGNYSSSETATNNKSSSLTTTTSSTQNNKLLIVNSHSGNRSDGGYFTATDVRQTTGIAAAAVPSVDDAYLSQGNGNLTLGPKAMFEGDPRHLGHPYTLVCGCVRYTCNRIVKGIVNEYLEIAHRRRLQANISRPWWESADERYDAIKRNVTHNAPVSMAGFYRRKRKRGGGGGGGH